MNKENDPMGGGEASHQVANPVQIGTTEIVIPTDTRQRDSDLHTDPALTGSFNPNVVKSVIDYLSKPIPVASGDWSTTQAFNAEVLNTDIWTLVYGQPLWREKLRGFFGLRSTVKLRLVVNGTPFHAGLLRMFYYPCAKVNPEKWPMHIGHPISSSQLPGVDISATDSSVELSIPYVSHQRFIELTSTIFSWGQLFIRVYSPLAVGPGGSNSIRWTLWLWQDDIELIGQTSQAINAQSNAQPSRANKRRRAPTEAEKTPVSSLLADGAAIAGGLSKIPVLTKYAGPTAWALNAMSGVASALGWSKPNHDNENSRMAHNYNWNTPNATGIDNATSLALFSDNKLSVITDPSPGGEDEMSIDFIKSRWSYFTSVSLPTTAAAGAQLSRIETHPLNFMNDVSATEKYITSTAYLGHLFTLYRGGMDIRVRFVKTAFHSGSLAFTFVPGVNSATMTLSDTAYCYRTIVDLQAGDEVCLRLPYVLPLDFINTEFGFGALFVHVINPLRAPETVAQSINMLVYVRGAPDREFAVPRHHKLVPIYAQGGIEPQAGDTEVEGETVCEVVGNFSEPDPNIMFQEHCTGEAVRSLLSLLKRYTLVYVSDSTTSKSLFISPHFLDFARINGSTTFRPSFRHHYMSGLLAGFAFMRGGMRYRHMSPTTYDDVKDRGLYGVYLPSSSYTTDRSYTSSPLTGPSSVGIYDTTYLAIGHSTQRNGGLAVQVPYHSPYRMMPVKYYSSDTDTIPFESSRGLLWSNDPNDSKTLLLRAVADDFQALFWVGVPRMGILA